jgi:hypothetical protein
MTDSPSSLIETVARALEDADIDNTLTVDLARAALLAIKSHAAENGNFCLLGDGWVICRNKEPGPITDDERAEIERRTALLSSRPRVT